MSRPESFDLGHRSLGGRITKLRVPSLYPLGRPRNLKTLTRQCGRQAQRKRRHELRRLGIKLR